MAKKKVRALGVWLSTDPDVSISLNYKDKIEKVDFGMLETSQTQPFWKNNCFKKPYSFTTSLHFFSS